MRARAITGAGSRRRSWLGSESTTASELISVRCRSWATVVELLTAFRVTVRLVVTEPTAVRRNLTDRLQDLPSVSVVQLPLASENGTVDDGHGPQEGVTAHDRRAHLGVECR